MELQETLALAITAVAVALLIWGRLRRRRFNPGRGSHCGCSAGTGGAAGGSIVYHARKGERSRIVVKMR